MEAEGEVPAGAEALAPGQEGTPPPRRPGDQRPARTRRTRKKVEDTVEGNKNGSSSVGDRSRMG